MKRFLSAVYKYMPSPFLRLGLFLASAKFNHGAVGIYEDSNGHVLVLNHVYRKGPAWGFPSGFVNTGESTADGALLEMREETGLTAMVDRVGETTLVAPRHLETVAYGRADSAQALRLCHEIFEACWVDPQNVREHIAKGLPPDQHRLMIALAKK